MKGQDEERLEDETDLSARLGEMRQRVSELEALVLRKEREHWELAEALTEAAAAVNGVLDPDQVLDRILEQIERVVLGDAANVAMLEEDNVRMVRWRGYEQVPPERLGVACPLANYANLVRMVQSGEPAIIHDVAADPDWVMVDGWDWVRSCVIAPIQVAGLTVGFLSVDGCREGQFGPDDARRLQAFASHVGVAIENARLYGATRQYVAGLEALQRTSLQLTSSLDLSAVLDTVVESALTLVGANDCHIYLYDEDTQTLTFGTALWEDGRREPAVQAPRPDGLTANVARGGQPIVIDDATRHPFYTTPQAKKWNVQSVAGFPLKRANRVLGVFTIAFLSPHPFGQEELRVLTLLADQAASAIENARLYAQARRDAETRSVLLREVNHRVKNNLSAIVGLLYAEQRRAGLKDQRGTGLDAYRSTLRSLSGRVQGLATVHSLLSASEWTPLSLSELTIQVIRSSLQMLPREKRVSVDVAPSPVHVTPDQAHNLGLVINELATNTVKHTLQDRDMARVAVRAVFDETAAVRAVSLEFRDDGPGYPEEVLRLERCNVGLDLVQNLVRKSLRGDLSLYNDRGAVTVVRFPAQV
jgi:GAF domain-containing protein